MPRIYGLNFVPSKYEGFVGKINRRRNSLNKQEMVRFRKLKAVHLFRWTGKRENTESGTTMSLKPTYLGYEAVWLSL